MFAEYASFGSDNLRLLTVREVTGRAEAVLSWVPDLALRRDAEGTGLHLSSHVLDPADGRVILFDGPRAVPCRGPEQTFGAAVDCSASAGAIPLAD